MTKVSRRTHYKFINAGRYIAGSLFAISFFAGMAIGRGDWAYLERSGGIVALLGAILGLRKLLRKGARDLHVPNLPLVEGNKFNTAAMIQEIEDISDAFAQELGLVLVVAGTVISAFAGPMLEAIWPLT